MDTSIYVTFALEGFHAWLDAPEEVAFLRNRHRHLYHYRAEISVHHDDRDIEFFMLQRELKEFAQDKVNDKSCEMMAREMVVFLRKKYFGRSVSVTVSEDGENGATVSYKHDPLLG